MDRLNKSLTEFAEDDALKQSLALSDVVKELLETTRHQLNKIYILLVVSILANLVIVGAFLWYESQWDCETTTTETVTQSVDGENSEINNVSGDQYKDEAVHNE